MASARRNDAVVLLANGASGAERTDERDQQFAAALGDVCAALAREIVADGEGCHGAPGDQCVGGNLERRSAGRCAANRDVPARENGGVRTRSELGARAGRSRFGALERRLRAYRPRQAHSSRSTAPRSSFVASRPVRSRSLVRAAVAIDLDLRLGAGSASYLASDLTV